MGVNNLSDEKYVLDLIAEIINEEYIGQKRFDTLLGDMGKNGRRAKLPVDAYFQKSNMIIEYKEKQHYQPVKIMDKRITISGVNRGEQRRLYDSRKKSWAKDNDIIFIEVPYIELSHGKNGRLLRNKEQDVPVLKKLIAGITRR